MSVVVWPYRDADLGFGSYQAKEMLDHLESVLANDPVAVKSGQFIVEVKPQPLSLAFKHVNYYVDMPEVRNILRVVCIDTVMLNLLLIIWLYAYREMKSQGMEETHLQLMDVLAGRKTGGYTDGSIIIFGYPKNQSTAARISGYCEQNDIHSPHVNCL
ncbi:hypothetical protein KY285_001219 [Solanum tuberosum]|nr:hypothetical protein KY285_001219 [Solanum tuberosum]